MSNNKVKCPYEEASCLCQYCKTNCKQGSQCLIKGSGKCVGGVYLCTSFTGVFPQGFEAKYNSNHGDKKYCYLCRSEGASYYEHDNAWLCPECAKSHPISCDVYWR